MTRVSPWLGRCVRAAVGLAFSVSMATHARAQNGGLFLLVPFGAHAVAQGEAVVADSALGTEAMWWNAAALARIGKKELAVHHSQTLIATSDMLTFAVPSRVLGTVAASVYLVNYGDQAATDPVNGTEIGTITNRNYQLALSYATPVGKRLSVGVTYKFIMLRFQCTGICGNVPIISGSTSALDLGAQYVLPTTLPITLGASVRNLGPALQVKDAEQADPLPRVIQIGGMARVPIRSLTAAGASLDVTLDVQSAAALNGAAGGLGVVLGYRDVAFLRGGYKLQPGDAKGPSIGFGFRRGGFALDLARRFDSASAQLGEPPTYVSLRARF
ncbi:PorV/PorQ family protein [Gemmatimonas sp.]|uniref:PorV/PorQ family protein n=1 Tax=Gemmatimonas sp. TaxID=1962908 RepID=UPI0035694A27